MTPEQILIDGLKEIIRTSCRFDRQITIAEEALQAYNEAKAREESAPIAPEITSYLRGRQDKEAGLNLSTALLTAAPLAEALRELLGCPMGLDQATVSPGLSADDMPPYKAVVSISCALTRVRNAEKALTQAETLIKHSEAVWAITKAGLKLFKSIEDEDLGDVSCLSINEPGIDAYEEYQNILAALPVEALEMMEVNQNDSNS